MQLRNPLIASQAGQERTILSPNHTTLRDIETPALVVDAAALQRNIEGMAAWARQARIALRPHAKTHKSVQIAGLQKRAGAMGIACATVAEAELLVSSGIEGILLTAPQMGEGRFARISKINSVHDIAVVVDHVRQVEGLAASIGRGDKALSVLVDVDVGHARTGIADIGEGVRLAQSIAASSRLEFAGIQGFAGHAQHMPRPDERNAAADKAADILRAFATALSEAGVACRVISGSGTGTYRRDAAGPYNELQVGSYVFMDSDYARIVDEKGAGPSFEPSLFVLATVVSVNRPGQVTVDAGSKALATNGPPPCSFVGTPEGSSYRFAGDEHGIISIPAGQGPPALGDRMLIGATHCDPTVNLHGRYHVVDDAGHVEIWPIGARYGA
ncbi:MAG TPA: DSD1 family PLP-dependent enzyme [Pseudolabrys sp.]|nr:DSD1 family PLP-dependent enzyme [Pseudolabrys sp.]